MIRKAFGAALLTLSMLLGLTSIASGANDETVFSLAAPANVIHLGLSTAGDFTGQTEAAVAVEHISVISWDETTVEFDRETLDLSLALNSEAMAGQVKKIGPSELVQVPVSASELGKAKQIEILFVVSPGDAFDLPNTVYEIPTKWFAFEPPSATDLSTVPAEAMTTGSLVVVNELMADNDTVSADPQGEFDDLIELANLGDQDVDLEGMYLSDDADNLRKWVFPSGTVISAGSYLLVWADDDVDDSPGLHASFKLSADGESLFLVDVDERANAILDQVDFDRQEVDVAYGRTPDGTGLFGTLQDPTPTTSNDSSEE